jgi:hypothetical protein
MEERRIKSYFFFSNKLYITYVIAKAGIPVRRSIKNIITGLSILHGFSYGGQPFSVQRGAEEKHVYLAEIKDISIVIIINTTKEVIIFLLLGLKSSFFII